MIIDNFCLSENEKPYEIIKTNVLENLVLEIPNKYLQDRGLINSETVLENRGYIRLNLTPNDGIQLVISFLRDTTAEIFLRNLKPIKGWVNQAQENKTINLFKPYILKILNDRKWEIDKNVQDLVASKILGNNEKKLPICIDKTLSNYCDNLLEVLKNIE